MNDFSVLDSWLFTAMCAFLAVMALLYLWPGARRRLLPPQRVRATPWSGAEVLLALLLFRLFWPAVGLVIVEKTELLRWIYGDSLAPVAGDDASQKLTLLRQNFWAATLSFPFALASVLLLFRWLSGTRLYQLGLTTQRLLQNVAIGIAVWVVFTPFLYVLNQVLGAAFKHWLNLNPDRHPLINLGLSPFGIDWALIVFSAVVAAPVTEELLFRGILQPWLARRPWAADLTLCGAGLMAFLNRASQITEAGGQPGLLPLVNELLPLLFVLVMVPGYLCLRIMRQPLAGAIYATALLFGAAHSFTWPTPIPLFILGLALGVIAYRTQSLIGPVVFHALFNGVACVLLFLSSPAQAPEIEKGSDATSAVLPAAPSTSSRLPGS